MAMNVTGDSDPGIYGKPKFNSTILGPDERPQEGNENSRQDGNFFQSFLPFFFLILKIFPRFHLKMSDCKSHLFP